eukprot:2880687-Rhodomonas_salina.2
MRFLVLDSGVYCQVAAAILVPCRRGCDAQPAADAVPQSWRAPPLRPRSLGHQTAPKLAPAAVDR